MPPTNIPEYDDDYHMCAYTFSSLSVHSPTLTHQDISKVLQLEPTATREKGQILAEGRFEAETNAWYYSTSKLCTSKDTRRYVDLLLRLLDGKAEAIQKLQADGCQFNLGSFWVPSKPQLGGGPRLTPCQMVALGNMGVSVSFWFTLPEENDATSMPRRG